MASLIPCPSCNRTLRLPAEVMGRQVRCPECQTTFTAEPPDDSPPLATEHVQSSPSPAYSLPRRTPDESFAKEPEEHGQWSADEEIARPRGISGPGRTTAAIALIAAVVVFDLVLILIGALTLQHLQTAPPAQLHREMDEPTPLDIADGCVSLLRLPVFIAAGVVFLMWVYQSYDNLKRLRARGLGHSPGWAVGYYFIPILSLYRPYQVMQETYKASDPEAEGRNGWQSSSGSSLIGLWWACWLLQGIAGYAAARMVLTARPEVETLTTAASISLFSNLLSVCAGLCLIAVMRSIRSRQEARYEALHGLRDD